MKEVNENLSDNEHKAIIEEFDKDGDGYITKDDFLKIMNGYQMMLIQMILKKKKY